MSQSHLAMYDPDGFFYGFPYWDVPLDYLYKRMQSYGSYYLDGLVRTLEHPTCLSARYMRARDLQFLDGC